MAISPPRTSSSVNVDDVALATGHVRRPCAGEAVGLLLLEDRRLLNSLARDWMA